MSRHINLLCILSIFLLSGCTTDKLLKKEDFTIEKETEVVDPVQPRKIPVHIPQVGKPDPLEGKTLTLTAKDAQFTDIFSAIAEIAELDLIIDSRITGFQATSTGSPPSLTADTDAAGQTPSNEDGRFISLRPITVAFNETPLKDALENITASLRIFYEVRGSSLFIKGTQSRTYHLNFLSSLKETTISVGGDVLGSSSTGDDSSGTNPLSGEFSIKDSTPTSSNDIYAQIELIVRSSLSPQGSYSLSRSIGLLEINDMRDSIERIDSYVNTIKRYYNSQVLITAKILEVSLGDSSRYGIDWTSMNGNIGDYAFNPIQQTLALSSDNLSPALQIEVHSDKHGIDAAMNALEEFGSIKVLSNPRIRVTNGQPALISVGTNTSYIREIKLTTTTSDGGTVITTPEVEIGSIFDGIMLGVLPYIDLETNQVNLSITPIKSRIVELKEKQIHGDLYTLPVVALEEASTQVRVKSGNVVALGGLISKNLSDESKSIPILGDIPYLGYLFSQKTKSVQTNELVILLEPIIIE
ncbi:MAG TPA: hypothetical protein ENN05_02520 [Deltaproteobacteria bacterium]|nr:hypothetical protein [Deltaproteobacteria bacterium]